MFAGQGAIDDPGQLPACHRRVRLEVGALLGGAGLRSIAGVAADDAMAIGHFYEGGERRVGRHIAEGRGLGRATRPPGGQGDDLHELPAGDLRVRTEVRPVIGITWGGRIPAGIAANELGVRCRLNRSKEGMIGRHIGKGVAIGRGIDCGQVEAGAHHLDDLSTCSARFQPERSVRITRQVTAARQVLHGIVESGACRYVAEGVRARLDAAGCGRL